MFWDAKGEMRLVERLKQTGATIGDCMEDEHHRSPSCAWSYLSRVQPANEVWLDLGHLAPSAPASLHLALQRGKELRNEED